MIKIAAYCRVSTDKDDQANSFESQRRYFWEYINRQPDWELYEVSRTGTKKRNAFNRMILDAQLGRFSLILTKGGQPVSRNILDVISYTRELKAIGVGVLFMNDGISTLEPDAELRLSIMGSIAQEESRKTSVRAKLGQARQMERGVVFGRSMLGYDVKDGRMTVNPTGAEIVRLIFQTSNAQGDLFLGELLHHMTVYPDGWAEIFLNLLPAKRFAFAESLMELQGRAQSAENPAAMRLRGTLSHCDPDVWGIGAKNGSPKTQFRAGLQA